jgi:hypothetical protein
MGKETNDIRIRYKSGVSHKGEINGEDYVEYTYDYISATTKSTKRYNNAICLLMGINGCAHHLIEWLSDNMTSGGYVNNNSITRNAFINFHKRFKKDTNKEYSQHAVIKAFKKLTEEGFLISIDKGTYQINPMLYFSSTEDERIRSIKYMMEFKSGVETKITVEVNKK